MVLSIGLSVVLTLLLIVMTIRLRRSLNTFRIKKQYTAAIDAPSVSICIPARNETHAMTQCLERVLASDYKKLEVIVYDDGSTDDTSILIRSFAHAGVRFVSGSRLPAGWLGKNHALEVLGREASGTFVVFMDVDTHIKPTTISQLVGYTMTEGTEMVSVIPGRYDAWRASVIFGHLRYFWEIILSHSGAPATSSALWLIKRSTLLKEFGGFRPHRMNVSPEMMMARALGVERYHCLVSDQTLGVAYEKKWSSQVETSRRLLYPRIGGTKTAAAGALLILLLLNLPFLIVLSGLLTEWTILHASASWFLLAHMAVYAIYVSNTWSNRWWLGGFLWPIVVLQELVLLLSSIVGYARKTITWKGRHVVVPSANP